MTPKELICEYCKDFNQKGWMPGCSGGISVLSEISPNNRSILITPGNVCKSDLKMGDLFELRFDFGGNRTVQPTKSSNQDPHIMANLAPVYLCLYQLKPSVHCIIESCSEWAVLAGDLALRLWESKGEAFPDEIRLSHISMLKNLEGCFQSQEMVLPVVENDVIDKLLETIPEILKKHPQSPGLLIRHHGILVWGNTPEKAKLNADYLHYMCQYALDRHRYLV